MPDILAKAQLSIREHPLYFRYFYPSKERPFFKARVVRQGYDAVIEGYPRSANTFATFAFRRAQPGTVKIGNHFHNAAQFTLAHRYGIPAMLCLREPISAACSLTLFRKDIDARDALLRYISFHKPLLAIRSSFVVAPFDEIVSNFDDSVARMNKRFGSNFRLPSISSEDRDAVFHEIRRYRNLRHDYYRQESMRDPLREALPNADKMAKKELAKAALHAPSLARLREEARELYDTLLGDLAELANGIVRSDG